MKKIQYMRLKPSSISFTVLLGVLAALPSLSIDMGLPAFPVIGISLNASPATVGLTISLFMVGYATGQLAFGPFSERYGRRPVLLTGYVIFVLANVACAFAPSINALVAWRFFAGAGAGAGMTLMMAMVRDLFEGATACAKLSYINLVMAIAPTLAPTIGGGVLAIANWRAIYGILAVVGLVLILAIAFGLDESIKSRDVNILKPHRLIGNYLRVLSNRLCIGYALVNALSFGCIFAYVAGSPLVMIEVMGISTTMYGLLLASTAISIMAGSFLSGQLNTRGIPPKRLLGFGLTLAATSAIGLVGVSLSGVVRVFTLLPLLIMNNFSYGMISPTSIHNALQPLPEMAGIAAAVIGFLRILTGALASVLVSFLFDGRTINFMSELMALFAISSLVIYSKLQVYDSPPR